MGELNKNPQKNIETTNKPFTTGVCKIIYYSIWKSVQYDRSNKTLEGKCFIMGGRNLNHKNLVRDVGLFIDESLNRNEHVKVRVGKAARLFVLWRRITMPSICTQTKAHLYRSIITTSSLFASECWELRNMNFKIIEKFNKMFWSGFVELWIERMLWPNRIFYHHSTLKCLETFYSSVASWKEDTM